MQVNGALRGVGTVPRRRRLNALLAILVVAVVVALLVWAVPLTTSGSGAESANLEAAGAGSAVLREDAGNVLTDEG